MFKQGFMSNKRVLIVDDEVDIRNLVQAILRDEGYETVVAQNSKQVYEALEAQDINLVVLDIWLKDSRHDGLEILEQIKQSQPYLPVIMISGHGTIETAVQAIKNGAYDFIEKPFKSDRLLLMVQRGLEAASLQKENIALKESKAKLEIEKDQDKVTETLLEVNDNCEPLNDMIHVGGRLLNLPLREAREIFECEYLNAQVDKFDGSVSKTAAFIGMERSALHRKLKSLQEKQTSQG